MTEQTIAIKQPGLLPEEAVTLSERMVSGALNGAAGAGLLAGIMYALWAANQGPKPLFLAAQQKDFGEHGAVDHVAGLGRFVAAGAAWGALFGAVNRKPSVLKGAAFGFAPSLFLWTVLAKTQGEKLFFGGETAKLVMPVVFNSAIWGSFIGKSLVSHPHHGETPVHH